MTELFKDRYKPGIFLAALFLAGILISAYQVYRLPALLLLTDSAHPALLNVYFSLIFTFVMGAIALWYALNHKNEVIVFRDKQLTQTSVNQTSAESGQTTILLDAVNESIRHASDEKQILQAGLHAICKQLEAGQGAVYMLKESEGNRILQLETGYALTIGETTVITYTLGEGLVGQTAASAKTIYLDDVPEGYIKIISGLGSASACFLLIAPIKHNDKVIGVAEIASFTPISDDQRKFVEESVQLVAHKIANK